LTTGCLPDLHPRQHGERRNLVIGRLQRAKRVREAAGGLSNDVGVPSFGLGFTGVQVGNVPHRKFRQIGNQHPFVRLTLAFLENEGQFDPLAFERTRKKLQSLVID